MAAARRLRLSALLAWALLAGGATSAATPAQQRLLEEHDQLQIALAERLKPLADFCREHALPEASAEVASVRSPLDEASLDIDALPEQLLPELSVTLPADELRWRAELRKERQQQADRLYLLAQRAIREGMPSTALRWIREVAFYDPDHIAARRILGYVRYEDRWTTPYTALMLRRGNVWHPEFGWLPKDHVQRYERGERFFAGQWMSAEKEAALRSTMSNAWEIESDHFVVKTNDSQQRGVELSVALEDLHRFFTREFADLFNTPQQMQQLFGDGKPRSTSSAAKHEVWYFKSGEEFARFVARKQPGMQGVNGLYLPKERCSYFFANPDDPQRNLETMYHEVTHQLLSESSPRMFPIAEDRDFWIVEGFACYLESFDRGDGRLSVGNPSHPRLYWARERVVAENWFIPIEEFSALGMRQFQFEPDFPTLQKYYSQATGLTHFLLHFDGGRYRDGGIAYLAQLYSPDKRVRLQPRSLEEILGVEYATLDAQYREYAAKLPVNAAGLSPAATE